MSWRNGSLFATAWLALTAGLSAAGPPARIDAYGDPLPPGARARVGTVRFRHGSTVMAVAYSPDGKTLAAIGQDAVRLWAPDTGKELRRYDGQPSFYRGAYSPDGRRLWLQTYEGALFVWDLLEAPDRGPRPAAFKGRHTWFVCPSPDGKAVATGDNKAVRLWDVTTGKELRRLEGHAEDVHGAAFSPDGKALATLSLRRVVLWGLAAGKARLQVEAPADGSSSFLSLAFSRDGRALAVNAFGAGNGSLRFWDTATGKELRSRRLKADAGRAVAFAPDGKTVAVAGQHALQLLDVASGKELWRRQVGHNQFFGLAFSPDGKSVAAGLVCTVRVWDTATGKERCPVPEHRDPVEFSALTADGRTLVTEGHEDGLPGTEEVGVDRRHVTLRHWDTATGRQLPRPARKPLSFPPLLALSPDGKVVATEGDGGDVLLYDTASGKRLSRLPRQEGRYVFSPDGKLLVTPVTGYGPPPVRMVSELPLWEVATGKEVGRFKGHDVMLLAMAFAPDGQAFAAASPQDGVVRLWDVASRRERRKIAAGEDAVVGLSFSPDGRLLAAGALHQPLRLWEVASGAEVRTLRTEAIKGRYPRGAHELAFCPDGKTLLATDLSGKVFAWDVRTGKLRREWQAHRSLVRALQVSADGKVLATRGATTALLWDLSALLPEGRPRRVPLAVGDLKSLWQDLEAEDATRAYQAVWSLAAAPSEAVPFLRERLRPATGRGGPAAGAVARLIAQLDSTEFAARERASRELARLGRLAEPELRKALAGRPSPEVRRRANAILQEWAKAGPPPLPPDELRDLHALAVLETAGTPEAVQFLGALARGAPAARLTQEAKASLGRLARRPR